MNIHLQEIIESFCPYCGENIQLLVDCSVPQQEYIEDCQVCCRPMQILANVNEEGIPVVQVQSEAD